MWIENAAAVDISNAFHHDAGPNSMLIQISDTGSWWPKPKFSFKEIHQFTFFDLEKGDEHWEELGISEEQAEQIATLLIKAKENKMNVVVHCTAGICRSGAVCEVGVMMGFQDTERYRQPNLLVKDRLLKALCMSYDPKEIPDLGSGGNYNFMEKDEDV